jgi:hypothetical protein
MTERAGLRYVRAEDVAAEFGLTARCVRGWADKGKIAGAYKLNGVWRFDPLKVREWAENRETWRKSIDAERRTGAGSSISAATYESRYTRLVGQKRKSGLPSGSAGSGP